MCECVFPAHQPGSSQWNSYLAQEVQICLATTLTLLSLRYLELYLFSDGQACTGRHITHMRVFLIFELAEEIPLLRRSTGKGLSAAVRKPGTFPSVNSIHVPIWTFFIYTLKNERSFIGIFGSMKNF